MTRIQIGMVEPLYGTMSIVLGYQSMIFNTHSMLVTYMCFVGFLWIHRLNIDLFLQIFQRQEISRYFFLGDIGFVSSLSIYIIQYLFLNQLVNPNECVAFKIDPGLPINIHDSQNPIRNCRKFPRNIRLSKANLDL